MSLSFTFSRQTKRKTATANRRAFRYPTKLDFLKIALFCISLKVASYITLIQQTEAGVTMANIQYSDSSFVSNRLIGKIQTAESIRISVKNDIAQVLSVGTESNVTGYEAVSGAVTFYGKTNLRLVYSDGTTLSGSSYNADFTSTLESDLISSDTKLTFDVVTVDTKVDSNANTATITVLLEVSVYGYVTESSPYFNECDDAFANRESVEVLESAEIADITAVIDEELTASRNISSVLLAESSLRITDYTNVNGVLNVSGEAVTRLTYVSDGSIVTDVLPFEFSRELDSSAIDSDCQLKLSVCPRGTKVRLDISENDVNTAFTVEIVANVRVEAAKLRVMQIVTDAYGENCDFTFEKRVVTTTLPCGSTTAKKTTVISLPLEDGKTPLTVINANAIVTKCRSGERVATVDGIVCGTLLCSTETGTEGVELELPFSHNIDVDYLAPSCDSFAKAVVCDFRVRKDSNLTCEVDLGFSIDSQRDVQYPLIVSAEETPFDKKQLPAIEICLAHKGETLWNLAKGLHMSEDDLLAANGDITNPLEKDTRIVVFNKI